MNVLAIDTTGDVLQLAFGPSGVKARMRKRKTRRHDEILLREIDALLKSCKAKISDIGLIVGATGPGRFTGIRIGLTFAEFFAAGLGVPACGVSHFEAWGAAHLAGGRNGHVGLVFPGQREDRFYQAFKTGPKGAAVVGKPIYLAPDQEPPLPRGGVLFTAEAPGVPVSWLLDAALAQGKKRRPPAPLYLKPASYER